MDARNFYTELFFSFAFCSVARCLVVNFNLIPRCQMIYYYTIWYLLAATPQLMHIPSPSEWPWYDTRSIVWRGLTGLNTQFSFSKTGCYDILKKHSLPYYLPIDRVKINGFIPFRMIIVLCKKYIQTAFARIWTRIASTLQTPSNYENQ